MAKPLKTKEPTYKLPGAKVILQFARFISTKRAQIASLAGEISQEYRDRKEKANVHSAAFNLCHRLVSVGEKNPMKLREWLAHFDAYRDDMKLDELSKSQADFVADQKEEEREVRKSKAAAADKAKKKTSAKKKGPADVTREAAEESADFLASQVEAKKIEEANRADLH